MRAARLLRRPAISVPPRWLLWGAIAALVAGRILLAALAWEPGWSALTWDDFTRVTIAQEWSEDPFLVVGDLVWLPLQTWLYGAVFALVGDAFAAHPMLLVALLNTAALMAAAVVVGWTAWRLFGDPAGAMIAFAAVLFSPWGLFVSLSGLSEPLFYLAVAVAGWALVAWLQERSTVRLAAGSLAVTAASLLRYEGWWLAVAWAWVIALTLVELEGPASLGHWARRWWERRGVMLLALAPLLAPAWWMLVNFLRTGHPLTFALRSAEYFRFAYGTALATDHLARLAYYPSALVRSAPFLLGLVVVCAVWTARHHRIARWLLALFGLQLGLFYATSVVPTTLGAFSERFMFSFVLALSPLLGALPAMIGRLQPARSRAAVAALLLALGALVTGYRLADRPQEWTHAPDLLALAEVVGRVAVDPADPVHVALGPGLNIERIPLAVRNGNRVVVTEWDSGGPPSVPADVDLWVERLPQRLLELPPASEAVGRYHLWGPLSERLAIPEACGCQGWGRTYEDGTTVTVLPNLYTFVEFLSDDPLPGHRAFLEEDISQRPVPRSGSLDLRWLYGHGFNTGRVAVEVRLDDEVLLTGDIGLHSRWREVDFVVPAGDGTSRLVVAVTASPWIESGWGWGRTSTVLVTDVEMDDG